MAAKNNKKAVRDANPKTVFGAQKADLSLIPPAAEYHMTCALENGRDKYGPFNWRHNDVPVMTYVAAIKRHLAAFVDGENFSQDAGVHHFGHIMASAAIVIDAIEGGQLIDDRPPPGPGRRLMYIKKDKVEASNEK